MAPLPKVVSELSSIEKFSVKSFKLLDRTNTSIEVVSTDGREYCIFSNTDVAKKYAAELYAKLEDDPDTYEQLDMFGMSALEYGKVLAEENGIEFILSYNQKHRVKLNKHIVAYRTI